MRGGWRGLKELQRLEGQPQGCSSLTGCGINMWLKNKVGNSLVHRHTQSARPGIAMLMQRSQEDFAFSQTKPKCAPASESGLNLGKDGRKEGVWVAQTSRNCWLPRAEGGREVHWGGGIPVPPRPHPTAMVIE